MILAIFTLCFSITNVTLADQLDKIISKGKLRCGIMLDVPPVGMRDAKNNPIGYDVEFLKDFKEWEKKGTTYISYGSKAEQFLAIQR